MRFRRFPVFGAPIPLSLALALSVGCGPRTLAVQIAIPDQDGVETPVAGARFLILPYDRDSVLRALAARAPLPRPSTTRLDSLFQAFGAAFAPYLRLTALYDRLRGGRDSVRSRLDATARADPAYAGLYGRYRGLDDSLASLARQLDSARPALARARDAILPEGDSLRRVLAAWEDTAYRAYDSITNAVVGRHRHGAHADSTRADGWTRLRLPRGDWWIYARAVNVANPYSEWYWNVKVSEDTLRLTAANGRTRVRLGS